MRNVLCLLVLGCSSSAQINITKSVGAEGGTVSGSDGTSVVIPMGALSMSSNITISPVDAAAPSGTVLVGPAYDFGPDGTTFTQPVTITLPFDSAKIPAGRTSADILIYTAARGATNYQVLQTSVSGNTVQTSATHFTVYLPAVVSGGGPPMDLGPAGNCTPTCTSNTGSCGCSETCSGHTYVLSCSGSTSVSCFCEIDGMTQSQPIQFSGMCSQSSAESAFFSSCAPG